MLACSGDWYDDMNEPGFSGPAGFGSGDGTAMTLLAGNSNQPLAKRVAAYLKERLGQSVVGRFSDGEVMVEIID